jgi:hypothetical protein
MHGGRHPRKRVREDLGVGVDAEHAHVLVRRDTRASPERVEELILQERERSTREQVSEML